MSTKREEILTALHGMPSGTTQQIAEKADTSQNTAHNTLKRMEMDGEVARIAHDRWHVT